MRFAVLLLAVVCLAGALHADRARASIYEVDVVERLQLTGSQKRDMERIIAVTRARQNRVFKKYGIDPNAKPNMWELQRAAPELKANAAYERAAAKEILSREQLQHYDALMREVRRRIIASF
jgi:hypothetical protein